MKRKSEIHSQSTSHPLDQAVTLDKARCAFAQGAMRFVVGPHPVDCECKGTGWIAVEDPVLGDLIDIRCLMTSV